MIIMHACVCAKIFGKKAALAVEKGGISVTVSYAKLRRVAFLLLALPSAVFAVGFLKWWIALPVVALLCFALYCALWKKDAEKAPAQDERVLKLPIRQMLVLFGIVMLWCFLSGLGNLYYQTGDWGARNAIFRDLIRFNWPVIYASKNAALVYYIGFWLPPALVGKLFFSLGCTLEAAFAIGNIALLFWSAIHLYTVFLLLMLFLRADTKKRFFAVILIVVCFSGMDIVGSLLPRITLGMKVHSHLEWWTKYQFSSTASCLGWVFNQAIPAWLTVSCFLHEKQMRNYALLAVLCASAAPLPCVGVAGYMLAVLGVRTVRAVREKQIFALCREVLSLQNLISAAVLLPMWMVYYLSNMAVSAAANGVAPKPDYVAVVTVILMAVAAAVGAFLLRKHKREWYSLAIPAAAFLAAGLWGIVNTELTMLYVGSFFLESGFYLLLLWWANRESLYYRVATVYVIIAPLIRLGTDFDFCMRVSIPTVFILMVLSARFLLENADCITRSGKKLGGRHLQRVLCIALIAVLAIGSFTLLAELRNGVVGVIKAGKLNAVNDTIITFDQHFGGAAAGADRNFIASDYGETFFFRYLAK